VVQEIKSKKNEIVKKDKRVFINNCFWYFTDPFYLNADECFIASLLAC
jgi:hypothetical protein